MPPLLERLFAILLAERIGSALALRIYAAADGEPLPEDFACITATDPAAPGEGFPGITHTITLSVCVPIERRAQAEALASAFLTLSLHDIATAAVGLYPPISYGHFYSWAPALSETDLTEGDRLTLTATAELTCARFTRGE